MDLHLTRRSALAGAATALAAPALAQAPWRPERPVRLIVGFAPGGLTDATARLIAPGLTELLGQSVVVENRPGAGANLSSEAVIRAPADGHTLLVSQGGQITINPHTYGSLPFNPVTDLAHITTILTGDLVLAVHPRLGVTTVQGLVELLRREPGRHNYATSASGGVVHVVTEVFRARTGTDMVSVHFRGSGPAIPEMLSGRVPVAFDAVPLLVQHIQSGALVALGVPSPRRSPVLPNVPTMAEAGLPNFEFLNWFGLHAPRGTPQPVLDRLNEATRQVLASEAVAGRIREVGNSPAGDGPGPLAARIESENRIFAEVVRAQSIRAD